MDFILLHVGYELKDKPGHAEQEVRSFVNYERAPGGDLELGVVVQHVVPRILEGLLQGVVGQEGVDVLHRQVGRVEDVHAVVRCHRSGTDHHSRPDPAALGEQPADLEARGGER